MLGGRRLFAYAKTKAEAEAKLRELKQKALSEGQSQQPGGKAKSAKTVSELIDLWLETGNFKPGTVQGYRYVIDVHITPYIGNIKLSRLSPTHIQELYNRVREKPSIAEKVHRILHRCFSVGVLWEELPENPCDRVLKPRYQIPAKSVWTRDQLHEFLAKARGHWLYPLWLLAISTGCRLGELLALRWSDVDLAAGRMSISRSSTWVKGQPVYSTPKTRAGARTIQLPEFVLQLLRDLREKNPDSELVFRAPKTGGPLHPSVVLHALKRECKRLDLPEMTPHGLRHLHASLLLSNHVPVPLVAKQLGHANPGVTMRIYAHVVGSSEVVSRAIEEVLPNAQEGPKTARAFQSSKGLDRRRRR